MTVPEILKETVAGDKFLQLEESITDKYGTEKKILIFCSPNQLEMLNRAESWIGDGTFEVVQKSLFYQLFIITAKMRSGVYLPALFAFLPNKELASYARVFSFLMSKGVAAPSSGFHCDFEINIRKAIKISYPEVPVYGCDTHFKRALRAHCVNELGLGSLYQNCKEFQTLFRYVWALSLVPIDDIHKVKLLNL